MTEWNEDIISTETAGTLDGLFRERVRRSPNKVANRSFDKQGGTWYDTTWSQMSSMVACCQQAMAHEDLEPGDRIAILMRNCREWVAFDQAALGLGLVVVPLYTDDRPDNIAFILNDAAAKLLIVHDLKLWKRLSSIDQPIESVNRIVICSNAPESPVVNEDERVRYLQQWMPTGKFDLQVCDRGTDELATIVYTSGTTGKPKGVMLSHKNILFVAHSGLLVYDIYLEDSFLSFLPLSHTFERTVGYYLAMMAGSSVAYARSIPQLAEDLQTIKPTILVAVPRIFERVYGRITQQLSKQSFIARWLFKATVSVGWKRFLARQGRARRSVFEIFWPLLDKLVASKVRVKLGGNLRLAVSGGAALSFQVARMFTGLGIHIFQGYGLTETAPIISGNPLDDNDLTSVGVPLPGVEVRIGKNDEIQVKSPGIMLGYWNNHKATKEMIGANGWLHTGDQGRIENDHIYITGRIKDILILSNGENVPPADMELAIALDPLIDQVMIIGEGRPFLGAILVLNPEEWVALANHYVVDPYKPESLKNDKIKRDILKILKKLLFEFPGHAKIRRVILTTEPWTVDNGLQTPTMKNKRNKILEHFTDEIEEVYSAGPGT